MGIKNIRNWFFEKTNIYKDIPIDFSIIIPTRARYTLLIRLLESILRQTYDLSKIEIFLMTDVDDVCTHDLISEFKYFNNNVNINLCKQERNEFINENYINKGASLSKGKYLWTLGNDCEIVTHHWDLIGKRKIEGYLQNKQDRICYIYINDDLPSGKRGCCFPLITRETFDCFQQRFMPKEITSYGADHWLWQCFNKVPYTSRILDISDSIVIKHYCSHNSRTLLDNISAIMYRGNTKKHWLTEGEESFYIQKLIDHIRR